MTIGSARYLNEGVNDFYLNHHGSAIVFVRQARRRAKASVGRVEVIYQDLRAAAARVLAPSIDIDQIQNGADVAFIGKSRALV